MVSSRPDPWLVAALAVCAALALYEVDWGLPAAGHSWAVDALEPRTVLGIMHHSFREWNSGWFYFKYPLGYPLILGVAFAPYLAGLLITGGWAGPSAALGTAFGDPERVFFVLSLIGRLLNLAFVLGTTVVIYTLARRLLGQSTARLAAWLTATSYPLVFYAHTTNVDPAYLFWMFLALLGAVQAADSDKRAPWITLGCAAAMALSTKEQAFGFLLPLPFLALRARVLSHGSLRACWSTPVRWMVLSGGVTVLLANNVLYNPLGFLARFAFLLGRPIGEAPAPLKPVSFAWFKGEQELFYLDGLWNGFESGLGVPLTWLALAGLAILLRNKRAALWLLVPAFAYYYLSLRGQQLITLRYMLPLVLLATISAAALPTRLADSMSDSSARFALQIMMVMLGTLSLARGIELDLLLHNDSRYQAEEWMGETLPLGAHGEAYQKRTYLPRAPNGMSIEHIPMPQRTIEMFQVRKPSFLILSSESAQSISHRWNPDWRDTGNLLVAVPEAVHFEQALREERLGYRRIALFQQKPRMLKLGITGLCPEISIYQPAADDGDDRRPIEEVPPSPGSRPAGEQP